MVNFTVDEIRRMMGQRRNIRNMSVIAHVDHGKSTLTDSLIGAAGIIACQKAGDARFMDTREDEQDRTITIKSTSVSLYFEISEDDLTGPILEEHTKWSAERATTKEMEWVAQGKSPYLVNLIDSPGHVDFSSEVTAALRVTDGALVVVDCVEGVCVQTETVLRQAISERIKPVLFVNKLDRIFLELHMDGETAYQSFARAVESVNVIIATYQDDTLGDCQVYPNKGTVSFGSGLHGWGFNLNKFAKIYAAKFGVDFDNMMAKLWGDNFFNKKQKTWTKKQYNAAGKKLTRAFCQFIMEPIETLFDAVMNDKNEVRDKMLAALEVKIPKDAEDLTGKPLLKRIMQTWLPAEHVLMQMIANHLPSPVTAQNYRMEILYSGPTDDDAAIGIKRCDPNGPLVMYVSKMVPTSEKGRFYAFGRVFSGTVATGQTVRIQGPDYQPGKKTDLFVKKIQRTVLMMGRYVEQLADCPCGNIVGLVGIDSYLLKAGTISSYEQCHNIVSMKYSVSPVVRRAVEVKNASDLPKLMEGLKRLAKSDPLVLCFTAPTGEHIVAGCGELHLEICLKDLQDDFMKGAPITVSDPVVSFNEGIGIETPQTCLSKSPNKHNRLYMKAEPIDEPTCKAIESDDLTMEMEMKVRTAMLVKNHNWQKDEAMKIWTFGCPPDGKMNILCDLTKGVQYVNDIKDSMVGAFIQHTAAGVLCDEAVRGCRFNLEDITLHADAIHRGAGQIMPPCKRVMAACQLRSEPIILEPMYLCDITVPSVAISGVYETLNSRRGEVVEQIEKEGNPIVNIRAYLPVLESFGFTGYLREKTSGQAFPQMIFSHWNRLNGDPLEEGSTCYDIIQGVRKKKGLKGEMPKFEDFNDKL